MVSRSFQLFSHSGIVFSHSQSATDSLVFPETLTGSRVYLNLPVKFAVTSDVQSILGTSKSFFVNHTFFQLFSQRDSVFSHNRCSSYSGYFLVVFAVSPVVSTYSHRGSVFRNYQGTSKVFTVVLGYSQIVSNEAAFSNTPYVQSTLWTSQSLRVRLSSFQVFIHQESVFRYFQCAAYSGNMPVAFDGSQFFSTFLSVGQCFQSLLMCSLFQKLPGRFGSFPGRFTLSVSGATFSVITHAQYVSGTLQSFSEVCEACNFFSHQGSVFSHLRHATYF